MRYLVGILAILLLASCSVKKRTYRDGYYVDWAFNKKTKSPAKISLPTHKAFPVVKEEMPIEIVSLKNSMGLNNSIFVSKNSEVVLIDTCGDVITFKSGDQVTARITEITDDKIKYKRCDNLDGPVFVVNKGTVETIRYANGVVEKIEAPQIVQTPNPYNSANNDKNTFKAPKRVHPYATAALLCMLFLFWLFGVGIILGAIFGYLAVKEIDKDPTRYKGRKLAKIVYGICIGIISFVLVVFVLSFI